MNCFIFTCASCAFLRLFIFQFFAPCLVTLLVCALNLPFFWDNFTNFILSLKIVEADWAEGIDPRAGCFMGMTLFFDRRRLLKRAEQYPSISLKLLLRLM
jgi:hypothetical protein